MSTHVDVPEGLFLAAYEPALVSSYSAGGVYRCKREYDAARGNICLNIEKRFIDEPLTTEVLRPGTIDATLYWKTGFRQRVVIQRAGPGGEHRKVTKTK
jgi:hypothetical protein